MKLLEHLLPKNNSQDQGDIQEQNFDQQEINKQALRYRQNQQAKQSIKFEQIEQPHIQIREHNDRMAQSSSLQNNKQSISRPLNATLVQSVDSQVLPQKKFQQQISKNQSKKSKQKKNKKSSHQKDGLNESLISQPNSENIDQNISETSSKKNKKQGRWIPKAFYIPLCTLIVGVTIFIASFIIMSQLKIQVVQQVILGKDNEGIWAHFPGDTDTHIIRNWTFFNITNAEEMMLFNQKPKFREVAGYKIAEFQDYLNITYIDDGDRVQMIDWLYFKEMAQSRSLDEKVKVLNVGALGYWYNLKISRPTIILQQGLSLLFTSLQDSIIENVYVQAIEGLVLPNFTTTMTNIFKPAGLTQDQALLLWHDAKYGLGNQSNLKYWIQAVASPEMKDNMTASEMQVELLNYFDMSDQSMKSILDGFDQYMDLIDNMVISNYYCNSAENCTGRQLAYKQMTNSFVTKYPPEKTPISPTQTFCQSNVTCEGSYPELTAYYKNVYLKRNPDKNSSLTFDQQLMKKWTDYNSSINPDNNYNTAESCLFHIGNLDALWDNGTKHDQLINLRQQNKYLDLQVIPERYLQNIRVRFQLPTLQHTMVFWEWIKYLTYQVILRNQTNEQLGIGNLFAKGMYKSFSYLQNNLQDFLLTETIYAQMQNSSINDCVNFVQKSMDLGQNQTALDICKFYNNQLSKQFVNDMLTVCKNKYRPIWNNFKDNFNLVSSKLNALCDPDSENITFGSLLHNKRLYLNDKYNCNPNHNIKTTIFNYCSDFKLAAIQWTSSEVTLNPPPQLNLDKSKSYQAWDKDAQKFQYGYYRSNYPNQTFPDISFDQASELLTFDEWFSASISLKQYIADTTDQKFKNYMKYVGIVSGLNGLTMERTPRQMIFGYNDSLLQQVRTMYPPFGGDPSTPSRIAFNDPNITQQQANLKLEWNTGKKDSRLVGQYRKIDDKQYIAIPKDSFNGNQTRTDYISPWIGQDYFYGTSAKQFSPNQFQYSNISLYVPNIQRYGSGGDNCTFDYDRFGFDLRIAYLGDQIYQSTEESDFNKKYYQTYRSFFNLSSVVGLPLFASKNHFMNCSSNWTELVEIYNEDQTIHYKNTSHWDDSFVIVEPYTGVSFQSTIYLQSNYYHEPDQLFSFYTKSMLPLFSLCRSGNITQQAVDKLFSPLKLGLGAQKWSRIIGLIIVAGSFGVCGIIYYRKRKGSKKSSESSKRQQPEVRNQQLDISLSTINRDDTNYAQLVKQSFMSEAGFIPPPEQESQQV